MTFFEVAFIGYVCLGDISLFGFKRVTIPPAARPAAAAVGLCKAEPKVERWPSKREAHRRIVALGQFAEPRLKWCENFRCWDRRITWETTPSFN